MPYTADDLVLEVAQRLGVAPDGQGAEPESAEKIRRVLRAVVGDLDARGVYAFPDLDAIPDAPFLHLADVVAGRVYGNLGIGAEQGMELTAKEQAGEMKLRRLNALPYSRASARPLFF